MEFMHLLNLLDINSLFSTVFSRQLLSNHTVVDDFQI